MAKRKTTGSAAHVALEGYKVYVVASAYSRGPHSTIRFIYHTSMHAHVIHVHRTPFDSSSMHARYTRTRNPIIRPPGVAVNHISGTVARQRPISARLACSNIHT